MCPYTHNIVNDIHAAYTGHLLLLKLDLPIRNDSYPRTLGLKMGNVTAFSVTARAAFRDPTTRHRRDTRRRSTPTSSQRNQHLSH